MRKLKNISEKAILLWLVNEDGTVRTEIVNPQDTVIVTEEKARSLTDPYLSGEWGVVEFEEVEEVAKNG